MDHSWLATDPRAAALLQGADDALADAPCGPLGPAREEEPRGEVDPALFAAVMAAAARRIDARTCAHYRALWCPPPAEEGPPSWREARTREDGGDPRGGSHSPP
jgi:hypothetical protein